MGVLDDLLNPQNSSVVRQIARQAGVDEADARSAVEHLSPMLARGIQRSIGAEGGLESLLRALQNGNHGRYLDDPGQLGSAVGDGNNILGHIFGSKEVSRGVASHVSKETGIGADLLKTMLPLVASLVMGALAKKTTGGGVLGGQQQALPSGGGLADILGSVLGGGQSSGGGLGGLLSSMLDSNRDNSVIDDILGTATRGAR